jgi:hypothetical protein
MSIMSWSVPDRVESHLLSRSRNGEGRTNADNTGVILATMEGAFSEEVILARG